MRVLEVARQFYPKIGGIESCVLNLSRGLQARGHHVEVVTLDRDLQTGKKLDSPDIVDAIPVHRLPYIGSRRYPIVPSWLRFAQDFDVLHIHAIDFFVDSAALAKRFGVHKKPVVVTTHGGIFHTTALPRLKNFYWNKLLPRSLQQVSAVVAVSEGDASLFRGIVASGKLVTIPNGIDPAFARTRRCRVRGRIVSVGRVSRAKANDRILELVARLAEEVPDIELFIAGPDEDETSADLRRLAEALGLGSRVHIVGRLTLGDLAALVANAHLFISAAEHEGFGITSVEALSAGTPVLVTQTGVHPEVVKPDVNGWFWSGKVDAASVATLREALLLPDARLAEMRDAARQSAEPFDWNLITARYERVLESASRKSERR